MATVFSKIISGELNSYKIAEDERFLAFLDAMPLAEGHTLVIPKQETDFIFDLDAELYRDLWSFAQTVGKKLQKAYPEKRITVAVVGLEVPHAHIHLVPVSHSGELNFTGERLKFSAGEYDEIRQKIANA